MTFNLDTEAGHVVSNGRVQHSAAVVSKMVSLYGMQVSWLKEGLDFVAFFGKFLLIFSLSFLSYLP